MTFICWESFPRYPSGWLPDEDAYRRGLPVEEAPGGDPPDGDVDQSSSRPPGPHGPLESAVPQGPWGTQGPPVGVPGNPNFTFNTAA